MVAVSAPVEAVPLGAFAPLQPTDPPEAVQAVALVELQLSVALAPAEMLVGDALKDTVGGAFEELLPPPPQAARAKEAAQVAAARTWRKFACAMRARAKSKRNDSLRVIFIVEFFVAKGADSVLLSALSLVIFRCPQSTPGRRFSGSCGPPDTSMPI